jgi:hypothetical protein
MFWGFSVWAGVAMCGCDDVRLTLALVEKGVYRGWKRTLMD